jgi:saccharopine dehydrogenase-like NADP-dependent oxidoreductase
MFGGAVARIIDTIAVVGLGKVGELVGTLLHAAGFDVTGIDLLTPEDVPFKVAPVDASDPAALGATLDRVDAVISCLPFHLNRVVAEAAAAGSLHYFDLTEDVPTTARVRELAAGVPSVVAPQCGLAPGLIAIVGSSLTAGFDDLRSIQLRVGALPQHPTGMLGYAFIWSPEGVVNEYLNDCEVLREGRRKIVPAMSEEEAVVISGTRLEAFLTSGGLGTMCETFEGRVERLDYKTLRYPGHLDLVRFFFDELLLRQRRQLAGEILVHAKPPVDDDIVYLYAAVEGRIRGELFRRQHVRRWLPRVIEGRVWRAISWTTACSACGVVELVADGVLSPSGLLRQEEIPLDALLGTKSGAHLSDQGSDASLPHAT